VKYLLTLALAVGLSTAFADGAPILLGAIKPSREESVVLDKIKKERQTKAVHEIGAVNAHALDARILEFKAGGVLRRYVGQQAAGVDGAVMWSGKSPEGDRLFMVRSKGALYARFNIGHRHFTLRRLGGNNYAIVETDESLKGEE
jgi:hypothetical protein